MPQVTVLVTNPDDMRLSVTAEMTVGEWAKITEMLGDQTKVSYFRPLDLFIEAIKGGIRAIKNRETIAYEVPKKKEKT